MPIVSILGNNDNFINYETVRPESPHGNDFFPWLWDLWYETQTLNHPERDAMKQTFLEGGWFEYAFTGIPGIERLSVLGINANVFTPKSPFNGDRAVA